MSLAFDKIQILPPSRNMIAQTFIVLQHLKKDHLQPISFPQIRQGQQTKGLKFISAQLKKLLMKNKRLGYHQISRILVQNFGGHYRQQKNIKRRVYDAINVLLAIGVISKNDQYISINYSSLIHTKFFVKEEQFPQNQRNKIEEKNNKLKKLRAIYKNLGLLVERNKQIKKTMKENRIIMQSKQVMHGSRAFEKMHFPGIFIKLEGRIQFKAVNGQSRVELVNKNIDRLEKFSFEQALDKLEFAEQDSDIVKQKELKRGKTNHRSNTRNKN